LHQIEQLLGAKSTELRRMSLKLLDEGRQISTATKSVRTRKVYEDLNKILHIEKPVDIDKAQATTKAMLEVLYQWADALGL